MAEGVAFDKSIMDAAADILDNRTDEELYKTYETLKTKIETEIGSAGTMWNGVQAEEFHNNFVEKHEPEFEKLHQNMHNAATNIREQANAWQSFDEQGN